MSEIITKIVKGYMKDPDIPWKENCMLPLYTPLIYKNEQWEMIQNKAFRDETLARKFLQDYVTQNQFYLEQ